NGDQSIPDRDSSRRNNSSESNKSNGDASQKFLDVNTNWREFRAMLYNNYQVMFFFHVPDASPILRDLARFSCVLAISILLSSSLYSVYYTVFFLDSQDSQRSNVYNFHSMVEKTDSVAQGGTPHVSKPLGPKWAHPLSVPETGCVLLATEKLDGVRTFERTVVLLLRSGTRHPQEGPFGVVINRPLHKKIKHMKPNNNELATTFADCSLHFGGPLEASMFLLKVGKKSKIGGFEEVIPGLCFGARNSLDEAAELVKRGTLKSEDFKFFVGYAGWQLDQLREEIESDYWHVAACSPHLIFGDSSDSWSESLWKEILQEMGGHYSELSRKPKQDI
ncbi:hypothetical protein Golob_011124, partial [Gossypium lobatum]|nr:hypothetical protein [Gossypium lobatum]